MNANKLFEEIRSYCQSNSNDAIVKKYSRYFKDKKLKIKKQLAIN